MLHIDIEFDGAPDDIKRVNDLKRKCHAEKKCILSFRKILWKTELAIKWWKKKTQPPKRFYCENCMYFLQPLECWVFLNSSSQPIRYVTLIWMFNSVCIVCLYEFIHKCEIVRPFLRNFSFSTQCLSLFLRCNASFISIPPISTYDTFSMWLKL